AQNPRPAPVSTTTPTSGSAASRGSDSSSAVSIDPESAFNRSGRFSVTTATPSLMVSSRSSAIGDPPEVTVRRWYHRPRREARHGSSRTRRGEGRESSLRGRAPGSARRAAGLPDLGAPDRAAPASALALSQQHPGHVLRAPGTPAAVSSGPQGRGAARTGRDLRGPRPSSAPRDQRRGGGGRLFGCSGDRRETTPSPPPTP